MSLPESGGHSAEPRCRIEKPKAAVLAWAALWLLATPDPSGAQTETVVPLTPPRAASAEAYLAAVAGQDLQTDVLYLPPDIPLGATVAEPAPQRDIELGGTPFALQLAAWIVLAVFLVALLFGLWRTRRNLSELIGPQSRDFTRNAEAPVDATPETWLDQDLIARLRSEPDPRVGLRLILQRFLALAASDNAMPLKRSLTTRELMRRLPGSWAHRGALETLAQRTELVVFGGRDISREAYEECLDMAKPFLVKTGSA